MSNMATFWLSNVVWNYILKSGKVLKYFLIQNMEKGKRNALSLNFKMQLLEVDKSECSKIEICKAFRLHLVCQWPIIVYSGHKEIL